MKTALFVIWLDTHFTELIRVAKLLKNSKKYTPILLFYREYPAKERDIKICNDEEITVIDSSGYRLNKTTPSNEWDFKRKDHLFYLRKIVKYLPQSLVFFSYHVFSEMNGLLAASRIIRRCKPVILILAEDCIGYETAIFIKVAHLSGIPSIIFPYTISNALEPAEGYFRNPDYHFEKWDNKIVGRIFPKWIYEYRGHKLVRLPAPQILKKELFGISPPQPWIMNSGAADAIAVENNFMLKYYRNEGIPESQLILTGAISDDILTNYLNNAQNERKTLCEELGMPLDHMLIVCALPPDQFNLSKEQTDFKSYSDLVKFWVQSLAELPNCNIVIRLHPRIRCEDMKYIEQWGVKISQRDTATLIPLCDIFVASISATIRWAIACGKPVVNYDVYRLRYNDYITAGGVVTIEEQQEFKDILQRLVKDPEYYSLLHQRQESVMKNWGNLNGNSTCTILQTIDNLVTQGKRSTK